MPTSQQSLQKAHDIAPFNGIIGLEGLRNAIDHDNKMNFIADYYNKYGHPENLDFLLESSYASFSMRFKGLRDCTDDPSEVWDDVAFMEKYTKALFATFFTGATFASVFPNEETKEKYFTLLTKYLYTDDFDKVMVEASQKFPREYSEYTSRQVKVLLGEK